MSTKIDHGILSYYKLKVKKLELATSNNLLLKQEQDNKKLSILIRAKAAEITWDNESKMDVTSRSFNKNFCARRYFVLLKMVSETAGWKIKKERLIYKMVEITTNHSKP